MGAFVRTVRGDVPVESLGLMLPHEHLFVDLRGPQVGGYAQADPETVVGVVKPHLDSAFTAGVTALVDCGTIGVGRNVAVLKRLAEVTPIHLVAPTGVYKEGFIPVEMDGLSAQALAEHWTADILDGMDGTDVRAGFIKIALSDSGPTALEERSLKAAALASQRTGAVVGSHTIGGAAARRELDILESAGLDLRQFIWIHAHTETDPAVHLEAARRGAWIEFDAIGAVSWFPDQERLVDFTCALLDAGCGGQILLSHDAGWYEPGQPGGLPAEGYRGYTALIETFIPALRRRGADDATIHQLTATNPAQAFALVS
jgi:phosphotriesterase-related protein